MFVARFMTFVCLLPCLNCEENNKEFKSLLWGLDMLTFAKDL